MLTDEAAGLPVEDGDLVDDVERQLPALDPGAEVDVDELRLGRHEVVARRELQLPDQLMRLRPRLGSDSAPHGNRKVDLVEAKNGKGLGEREAKKGKRSREEKERERGEVGLRFKRSHIY